MKGSRSRPESFIVPDMGRRRGQRKGHLHPKGQSWLLEWREYHKDASGQTAPVRCSRAICPLVDPATRKKITRREAERIAWELVLSKLDAITLREQSLISVGEFIRRHFEPEWIWSLKSGGQRHYRDILKHICPPEWQAKTYTQPGRVVDAGGRWYVALAKGRTGEKPPEWPRDGAEVADGQTRWRETEGVFLTRVRIKDVTPYHCQALVRRLIDSGRSVQVAVHVRNALSAIFAHAIATGHYAGANPAAAVRLPEMTRRATHALTAAQAGEVFRALPEPARTMALLSMLCSLNVAELCALRWRWVNLSDQVQIAGAEALPPRTLAVREQFYRGAFGSLKAGKRRRNVPLTNPALEALKRIRKAEAGPDDLVFQSAAGTPVLEVNLAARVLRPLGKKLALGFSLGWHVFRHTAATLAEQAGMPLSDRQALMGHASGEMTLRYTHSDTERLRAGIERMEQLIFAKRKEEPAGLETLRPASERTQ